MKKIIVSLVLFVFTAHFNYAQEVYLKQEGQTVWTSFENLSGAKGAGAKENKGAKGHAFDRIAAGDSCVLLDVKGPGIINRIWMTVNERGPEMLRALKIKMYWDNASVPAVAAPLGDFFCNGGATMTVFENCFFSNPEGRSLNASVPMPFRTGARVVLVNESNKNLGLLFFDINLTRLKKWNPDMLYFHCYWNRENPSTLGKDFTVLPETRGQGRFLGVSFGIYENPIYKGSWWGEGEMKFYIDGDKEHPSLCGTGVEDYIGSAWGLGAYSNRYQGCPIAGKNKLWSFYRFHVPDPVLFTENCRVTLQQIGGEDYEKALELYREKAPMIPISVSQAKEEKYTNLLDAVKPLSIEDSAFPRGWVNFYRQDDVSAIAYFYLNRPVR